MKLTITAALALLTALAALVVAAPASATTTQVSGTQTLVDPVAGTYLMAGDLVGDWYTDSLELHFVPGGVGIAWPVTGTEHFIGCLDTSGDGTCAQEELGRLDFEFTFTASASGNGRCQHQIVPGPDLSATDPFAAATGVLTFKDRPTTTGVETTYEGHIKL